MHFDKFEDVCYFCDTVDVVDQMQKKSKSKKKVEKHKILEVTKYGKRSEHLYANDGARICSKESLKFYMAVVKLFEATGRNRVKIPTFLKFCTTLVKAKAGSTLQDAITLYSEMEATLLLNSRPLAPHDAAQLSKMETAFLKQKRALTEFCCLKDEAEKLTRCVERQSHRTDWLASHATTQLDLSSGSSSSSGDCMALKQLEWRLPTAAVAMEEQLRCARTAAVSYNFSSNEQPLSVTLFFPNVGHENRTENFSERYEQSCHTSSTTGCSASGSSTSGSSRNSGYESGYSCGGDDSVSEEHIDALSSDSNLERGLVDRPVYSREPSANAGKKRTHMMISNGVKVSSAPPTFPYSAVNPNTVGLWDAFLTDETCGEYGWGRDDEESDILGPDYMLFCDV